MSRRQRTVLNSRSVWATHRSLKNKWQSSISSPDWFTSLTFEPWSSQFQDCTSAAACLVCRCSHPAGCPHPPLNEISAALETGQRRVKWKLRSPRTSLVHQVPVTADSPTSICYGSQGILRSPLSLGWVNVPFHCFKQAGVVETFTRRQRHTVGMSAHGSTYYPTSTDLPHSKIPPDLKKKLFVKKEIS